MSVPLNRKSLQYLWNSIDCFLLDCDGVVWRGNIPIPGAAAAIDLMKRNGKRVILVTNNSTKGPPQYVEKCRRLGISVSTQNDIVTSSRVASIYLKNMPNRTGKVYVLGGQGLGSELKAANVEHFGIGPDYTDKQTVLDDQSVDVQLESNVFAVLVGFDRYICYNKLVKAASYLKNEKCLFFATNDDAFFPSESSQIALPGAGCIVQAVSYSSQRMPVVLGKPHTPMFEYVRDELKVDPKRAMMIGDWPPTDIRFAKRNGMASMLVLSGNATLEDAQKPKEQEMMADFYCNSLKTLCDLENV
uniref:Phosphoglycolate phosphatase n=1 Tax=Trichuris muris TaxID=70415 RepID=A0A5S6QLH8_TRIMR